MGVIISSVSIKPNPVKVKSTYTIAVALKETTAEPTMYRLDFKLNGLKGNLAKAE